MTVKSLLASSPRVFPFLAILLGIGFLPQRGAADTTVYQDTFDNSGEVWPTVKNGTVSVVGDGGAFGTGNVMHVFAQQNFVRTSTPIPLQTLNIGDSITLDFDMRFTSDPVNAGVGFRFALENTALGTSYAFEGGTSAGGSSQKSSFDYYPDTMISGSNATVLASGNDPTISDKTVHHMSLTALLTANSVDLTVNYAGNTYTAIDTSASRFGSFDQIEVGDGSVQTNFNIDNVEVSVTAVPELGTAAFGLIFLVAGVTHRRRFVLNG